MTDPVRAAAPWELNATALEPRAERPAFAPPTPRGTTRLVRRPVVMLSVAAALAFLAAPAVAPAQSVGASEDTARKAANALRDDPVYVDPDAERKISARDADDLRARIRQGDAGTVLVAIVPK